MEQGGAGALEPEHEDGLADGQLADLRVPLAEILEPQAIHQRAHQALAQQQPAERVELGLLLQRREQLAQRLAKRLVGEVVKPALAPGRGDQRRLVERRSRHSDPLERAPAGQRSRTGSGNRGGWNPGAGAEAQAGSSESFTTRVIGWGCASARIQRKHMVPCE